MVDILESLSLLDVFLHFLTSCLVEKETLVPPPLGLGVYLVLGVGYVDSSNVGPLKSLREGGLSSSVKDFPPLHVSSVNEINISLSMYFFPDDPFGVTYISPSS